MSDDNQLPVEAREVAREVVEFAREIMDIMRPLAPLGEEAVGIALDWTRYWRYRNALKIRDLVNDLHRERGITAKVPIPPRLGIPLLDAASMEDDPDLQEMWAGLVANATDPDRRQDARKIFTHILSNIEPIDTIILRHLAGCWDRASGQQGKEIEIEEASVSLGIDAREIQARLHNLARLGCLRPDSPANLIAAEGGRVSTAPWIRSDEAAYHLTSLAIDLLTACEA